MIRAIINGGQSFISGDGLRIALWLCLTLGLAIPVGCREERACVPGASIACSGISGCRGAQVCAADGLSLGGCVCDSEGAEAGLPISDGGHTGAGGPPREGGQAGTGGNAEEPPDEPSATCRGYATRYWDCCKAHCGWAGNVPNGVAPVTSCTQNDRPHEGAFDVVSSCDSLGANSAYTCFSMSPRAIDDTLSYGFAAVPSAGDVCGRCYELGFDGTGHHDANDPGSRALRGKRMIVQATNIGHDVAGRQFDILVPGGGVGLFDACSHQWGLQDQGALGAQYGGILTACRQAHGDHADVKACVLGRCETLFGADQLADLHAGCTWFVNWFEAADNPNLDYREVDCPADLVATSGVDRRPLADVAMCEEGGNGGNGEGRGECECDCAWADGGNSCGEDDGSCCWWACCGD